MEKWANIPKEGDEEVARINKSALTKLEIMRSACQEFLANGYSGTTVKKLCAHLDMSAGNLTFYYPTKEHLLAELSVICCDFLWNKMEEVAKDGTNSMLALSLEIAAIAAMCEEDPVAKDFFLSSYTSPMCLEIIRKSDAARAKMIFESYCPDWTDVQYMESEILVSGMIYASLMTTPNSVPLDMQVQSTIDLVLKLYQVPEELRRQKIGKVLAMDYRAVGRQMMKDFKQYVTEVNEQALLALIRSK